MAGKMKRYNLVMAEDLFNQLEAVAETRQTTVVDLLRRFIKLGLIAVQAEETEGSQLIIRQGEHERELILI